MLTTYPRFDTQGRALEQDVVSVDPRRVITEEQLASFAADSGLDGVFVAGALSMFVTHERSGVVMWRALATTTANPMLKAEYHRMEKESEALVDAYESAITELGGDPMYVSPAARATEAIDSKAVEALLLTGGADPMTTDAKTVNVAGMGAMGCVMNVEILRSFVEESEKGSSRQTLQRLLDAVGPPSHAHHSWATEMAVQLATTAAKHKTTAKVLNKAEELVDKVQKKLST